MARYSRSIAVRSCITEDKTAQRQRHSPMSRGGGKARHHASVFVSIWSLEPLISPLSRSSKPGGIWRGDNKIDMCSYRSRRRGQHHEALAARFGNRLITSQAVRDSNAHTTTWLPSAAARHAVCCAGNADHP